MTYSKKNPKTIEEMFDSISSNYDKTNAVLSLQLHKRWNAALVKQALIPNKPSVVLDLCCGTGAIAFDYLKRTETPCTAYMLDFSEGMLEMARKRANQQALSRHTINYLKADAQNIPLATRSIDCVTIAYGIRNIQDPKRCMEEVFRVLKTNGTFGILELTRPTNPFMRIGHKLYLRVIIPFIGKLLTSNKEAYSYLCDSIPNFLPPETLESLLHKVGFNQIQRKSLFGGIATLLIAQKN